MISASRRPVLIVVGASFANHTGIAPYKPILQIDDNPAAIGRFNPVGAGITGDAALTLDALLEELGATRTEDQRPDGPSSPSPGTAASASTPPSSPPP